MRNGIEVQDRLSFKKIKSHDGFDVGTSVASNP